DARRELVLPPELDGIGRDARIGRVCGDVFLLRPHAGVDRQLVAHRPRVLHEQTVHVRLHIALRDETLLWRWAVAAHLVVAKRARHRSRPAGVRHAPPETDQVLQLAADDVIGATIELHTALDLVRA